MKKSIPRLLCMLIVVCMMLISTNALALSNRSTWQNFPLQKRYSYSQGYTYAIQRILSTRYYRYNPNTGAPEAFSTSNDVDGGFGPITESAVKAFQTWVGLTSDGKVGTNTWGSLYDCLSYNSSKSTNEFDAYSVSCFGYVYLAAARQVDAHTWCYFLSNSNSNPHWFHYGPSILGFPQED